jgi:NADP-dependent 3-hydroxy acid dehydrogenase YdfG
LPVMRKQKSGHIVTVSSTTGYSADPTGAVYSGTKYAVRAIMEGMRKEESPTFNIRSTIVSPGLTETELADHISTTEVRDMVKQMKQAAFSPDSIDRAISYAIHAPDDTSVSEIIVRPTAQFQ